MYNELWSPWAPALPGDGRFGSGPCHWEEGSGPCAELPPPAKPPTPASPSALRICSFPTQAQFPFHFQNDVSTSPRGIALVCSQVSRPDNVDHNIGTII